MMVRTRFAPRALGLLAFALPGLPAPLAGDDEIPPVLVRSLWKRAAYLETQQDDAAGARALYQRIVDESSQTQEAERARLRLQALDGETPLPSRRDRRPGAEERTAAARRLAEGRVAQLLRQEELYRRSLRRDREQTQAASPPEHPRWFTEELTKARREKVDRATLRERLVDRAIAESVAARSDRAGLLPPELRRRTARARAQGVPEDEIRRRIQQWLRDREDG